MQKRIPDGSALQFTQDMIGKRVRELGTWGTFDEGVITGPTNYVNSRVYVNWLTGDFTGSNLNIPLDEIEFIPHPEQVEALPEILTINGKRYQLIKE